MKLVSYTLILAAAATLTMAVPSPSEVDIHAAATVALATRADQTCCSTRDMQRCGSQITSSLGIVISTAFEACSTL